MGYWKKLLFVCKIFFARFVKAFDACSILKCFWYFSLVINILLWKKVTANKFFTGYSQKIKSSQIKVSLQYKKYKLHTEVNKSRKKFYSNTVEFVKWTYKKFTHQSMFRVQDLDMETHSLINISTVTAVSKTNNKDIIQTCMNILHVIRWGFQTV